MTRWKSLRDRFLKEKKKVDTLPSGAAAVGSSSWEHFEPMRFLQDYLKHKPCVDLGYSVSWNAC